MQDVEHCVREYVGRTFLLPGGATDLSSQASFLEHGLIDSTGVLS